MANALLQPAYEAAIRAKNLVGVVLQGEPPTIDLLQISATNKEAEVVATLRGTWAFREVSLGMGIWQDEFTVVEGALSEEDFQRVTAIDKNGRRFTIKAKARPEGTRRYWVLATAPNERTTS